MTLPHETWLAVAALDRLADVVERTARLAGHDPSRLVASVLAHRTSAEARASLGELRGLVRLVPGEARAGVMERIVDIQLRAARPATTEGRLGAVLERRLRLRERLQGRVPGGAAERMAGDGVARELQGVLSLGYDLVRDAQDAAGALGAVLQEDPGLQGEWLAALTAATEGLGRLADLGAHTVTTGRAGVRERGRGPALN